LSQDNASAFLGRKPVEVCGVAGVRALGIAYTVPAIGWCLQIAVVTAIEVARASSIGDGFRA